MVVNVVEEVDVWLGLSNPGLSNPYTGVGQDVFLPRPSTTRCLGQKALYIREWPRSTASFVPKSITVPGNPVKQDKQISFQANSSVYTTCRVLPKL